MPKKGEHLSEENRNKLREFHSGKILSVEHKNKISIGLQKYYEAHAGVWKGKKRSLEDRKRMSESRKGIPHPWNLRRKGIPMSESTKKKLSESIKRHHANYGHNMLGNKLSPERIAYLKEVNKGEKNPNWKGGVSPINTRIRQSLEYRQWRESVFKRDNYTCQECSAHTGNGHRVRLHADHIKPFAHFPELRFELTNGRTLCKQCHQKTATYGGNGNKLAYA